MTTWYESVLAAWPYSERLLFVVGYTLALELALWPFAGAVATAERLGWLERWAIPRTTRAATATAAAGKAPPPPRGPPAALVREALGETLVGHFLVRPPLLWFAYPLFCRAAGGAAALMGAAAQPSAAAMAYSLAVAILVDDTCFYWSHRALHEVCRCRPALLCCVCRVFAFRSCVDDIYIAWSNARQVPRLRRLGRLFLPIFVPLAPIHCRGTTSLRGGRTFAPPHTHT
jgi:hypothetical protein